MPPFTRVDLNQQTATIHLVIDQVEQVKCLADAPVLRQRPSHAGLAAAALKGLHEIVSVYDPKLERASHPQQVLPILSNEAGVDAVASDAVQRTVVSSWVDAIETGVAKIRQAWAEAIAKQHEQPEDNVGIYMDVPGPAPCVMPHVRIRLKTHGCLT
jgi:hypothetical protein